MQQPSIVWLQGPLLAIGLPALGRIDQVLELLSKLAVALPRLMRGELHSSGEETILIAGNVALEQRHDMAGGGHSLFSRVSLHMPRRYDVNFSTAICIAKTCLFPFRASATISLQPRADVVEKRRLQSPRNAALGGCGVVFVIVTSKPASQSMADGSCETWLSS